jgi:hypothetical protein
MHCRPSPTTATKQPGEPADPPPTTPQSQVWTGPAGSYVVAVGPTWNEDGLTVSGGYVRLDEGPSVYGLTPIVVLDVNGTERGIWLAQTALRQQFADELARRGERDFLPGERITIERGAEKMKGTRYSYSPFSVIFADAPRRDAASILSGVRRTTGGVCARRWPRSNWSRNTTRAD